MAKERIHLPRWLVPYAGWAILGSVMLLSCPAHGAPGFRGCGKRDRALERVAELLLKRRQAGRPAPTELQLRRLLRREGSPRLWPRWFMLSGKRLRSPVVKIRVGRFLAGLPTGVQRRCGVVRGQSDGKQWLSLVVANGGVRRLRVPSNPQLGRWSVVRASLASNVVDAGMWLLPPHGLPRQPFLARKGGRLHTRFSVDQPGRWVVQVTADTGHGLLPVAQKEFWVGPKPKRLLRAPGERRGKLSDPAPKRLFKMLNGARKSEHLKGLPWGKELAKEAENTLRLLMARRRISHHLREGSPSERLQSAGYEPLEVGENIAHGPTLGALHRQLWGSPTHRANLLSNRYNEVGIAVRKGPQGHYWAVQLFARWRRPTRGRRSPQGQSSRR